MIETAAEAKEVWDYDPETGDFRYVLHPHRTMIGQLAGTTTVYGYRALCYQHKKYLAHRVAWLIMTGAYPPGEIDHVDCNRQNNAWVNLREAMRSQQLCNARTRKDNILGVKGVCPSGYGGYAAYICFKGKRKNLGSFASLQEAKAVYDAAAKEWHGTFARSA
jgi:hypothetical protein